MLDSRIFVSFNPFSIYVTQADVKPGCVLRAANVVQVLQGRGLLTDEEVRMWSVMCGLAGRRDWQVMLARPSIQHLSPQPNNTACR